MGIRIIQIDIAYRAAHKNKDHEDSTCVEPLQKHFVTHKKKKNENRVHDTYTEPFISSFKHAIIIQNFRSIECFIR